MTPTSIATRLGGDAFLAQTLRRDYRHIPGSPGDAEHLMTWHALNTLLSTHRLEAPRLRVALNGDALPAHRYTRPVTTRRHTVWHQVQPADLHARLRDGATLVLDAADELHPPLARFAEDLERFLRTGVQINVYASWTGTEGFGTHWDDHDVIVMQLEGAKRWRIFGPTRVLPMHRDVEFDAGAPPTEPIAELVLRPGDLLYLPRGWWHAVSADQGLHSMHITCGLQTHTGADLIGWLSEILRTHTEIRADLPTHDTHEEKAAYLDQLRKLVTDELRDPSLIDRYAAARDGADTGRTRTSLPTLGDIPPDPGLRVRMTTARARLHTGPDTVTLAAAGTEWDFAPAAEPMLRLLVDGATVTVAQLAQAAGITAHDTAAVLTELVSGQAVTVEAAP